MAHIPGSIIRLKVTNFVTFDAVEFRPGPSLNLVIGPNGSGKSTLVSAICLGLGGKPTVLNDQKRLVNFVKQGTDKSTIEVEIQGRPGEANPVITREFGPEDNSSKWALQGQPVPEKRIHEVVTSYNIQVSNLCQFLPQDRVYDFCKLKAEDILKETEKAAGDASMFQEHEELIKFGAEETQKAEQLNNEKSVLDSLVRKNESIRSEVERFRKREENARRLRVCQLKRPWLLYDRARNQYIDIKKQRTTLKREMSSFTEENEPLIKQLIKKQNDVERLNAQKKEIGDSIKRANKAVDDLSAKIEIQETSIDGLRREMSSLVENREKRLKELRQREVKIEEIKRQIDEAHYPDMSQVQELSTRINELNALLRENTFQVEQLQGEMRDIQKDMEHINHDLLDRRRKMTDLTDQGALRLRHFKDDYGLRDTYHAIMWLRNNLNVCRGIVHEPLALTVNVADPQYAAEVEAAIPFHLLQAFLVESSEDQALLHDALQAKGWRHNIYKIPSYRPEFMPSQDDLRRIRAEGFDNFAINLINAPEPIKNVLCDRAFLHQVPIGKGNVDIENMTHRAYFANGYEYHTNQSSYGNRARVTVQERIHPAKLLKLSVDTQQREKLVEEIAYLEGELAKLNTQRMELERKDDAIRRKDSPLREEKNRITKEKSTIMDLQNSVKGLHSTLETEISRFKRQEAELNRQDIAREQADIEVKLKAKVLERSNLAIKAAAAHTSCLEALRNRVTLLISITVHEAALAKLQQEHHIIQQRLDAYQVEYDRLVTSEGTSKKAAEAALARAREVGQPSADDKAEFESMPNDVDDLDAVLAELEAKLRVLSDMSGNIVREYEDREREIEQLRAVVREKEADLSARREHVNGLKTTWVPRVEALVARISNAFALFMARLNNVGEVKLEQNPDYNKWRVAIQVKFRPSDPLIELSNHHHSGGERTVSTILYLMSLQETARSPFRLVDEINQGMDKNNERSVYREIVNTATRANTSQYFLITPKLLTNLDYNEKMKVHCVYNGKEQPSHNQAVNSLAGGGGANSQQSRSSGKEDESMAPWLYRQRTKQRLFVASMVACALVACFTVAYPAVISPDPGLKRQRQQMRAKHQATSGTQGQYPYK